MTRNQDGWIAAYQGKDALQIHNGDPKRPHALLTSGKHSNGFFNSRLVIPDEALLREAAADLFEFYDELRQFGTKTQVIVGPQTGATKLAQLLSEVTTRKTGLFCRWASPAKQLMDTQKAMVFDSKELDFLPGQSVLLCEDVLTTGGSVDLTADAIANAGGIILPFLLVLVNRSGLTEVNNKKIIALIDRPMPMWDSSNDGCPLCKEGSEAVRPKENWALLNANE